MKTVDEIYLAIRNNINDVIKENWGTAILKFEVIGDMVSNQGTYVNEKGENKQIDVDELDFELTFDLLDLHAITTEGGANKWNRAVYTLTPDGKFDMEFIWDQALQDEIERLSKE